MRALVIVVPLVCYQGGARGELHGNRKNLIARLFHKAFPNHKPIPLKPEKNLRHEGGGFFQHVQCNVCIILVFLLQVLDFFPLPYFLFLAAFGLRPYCSLSWGRVKDFAGAGAGELPREWESLMEISAAFCG